MKNRGKTKNFLPVIAFGLILMAGIAFYQAQRAVSHLKPVVTAKANIEPFTIIKPENVTFADVPEASITPNDITKENYEKNYNGTTGKLLVSTQQFLQGQRVDSRETNTISEGDPATMAAVSPDERVIGVSATSTAIALNKIHAGDVVNATVTDSGGGDIQTAQFAKVLCISLSANDCLVRTNGVGGSSKEDNSGNKGAAVQILLSVAEQDADSLSGKQVALTLNPFCHIAVKPQGDIETGDFVGRLCQVPKARLASATKASDVIQGAEEMTTTDGTDTTSTTDTTGTTTDTTATNTTETTATTETTKKP